MATKLKKRAHLIIEEASSLICPAPPPMLLASQARQLCK